MEPIKAVRIIKAGFKFHKNVTYMHDEQWKRIETLLPKPRKGRVRRPPTDNRKALEGILCILSTGARQNRKRWIVERTFSWIGNYAGCWFDMNICFRFITRLSILLAS